MLGDRKWTVALFSHKLYTESSFYLTNNTLQPLGRQVQRWCLRNTQHLLRESQATRTSMCSAQTKEIFSFISGGMLVLSAGL